MRCQSCEFILPENVTFCPNCGARVQTSSAGAETISIGNLPSTPSTPPAASTPQSAPPPDAPYTSFASGIPQASFPATTYMPTTLPNSSAAIVSLVFGILSWTILPLVSAIIAVIAGHMAIAEIRRSSGSLGGRGLAIAGLVMGYAQIALLILAICAIIVIGVLTTLGTRS